MFHFEKLSSAVVDIYFLVGTTNCIIGFYSSNCITFVMSKILRVMESQYHVVIILKFNVSATKYHLYRVVKKMKSWTHPLSGQKSADFIFNNCVGIDSIDRLDLTRPTVISVCKYHIFFQIISV